MTVVSKCVEILLEEKRFISRWFYEIKLIVKLLSHKNSTLNLESILLCEIEQVNSYKNHVN